MTWTYQGQPFTNPSDHFGFVYIITNTVTCRHYIGRKLFTRAKIKAKTKTTRKKKLRVSSDWENYYGSSQELKDDVRIFGKESFTREILRLCTKRGETNYWEAYEILTRGALLSDQYYNKWCSLKLHKSTLAHLK